MSGHTAHAERLMAWVWEIVRRDGHGWDSLDIAALLTAVERHMCPADLDRQHRALPPLEVPMSDGRGRALVAF